MNETERILNFLNEYKSLCKKYNVSIEGCGCCGSPFIKTENGTTDFENVSFDFECEKLSFDIPTITDGRIG